MNIAALSGLALGIGNIGSGPWSKRLGRKHARALPEKYGRPLDWFVKRKRRKAIAKASRLINRRKARARASGK